MNNNKNKEEFLDTTYNIEEKVDKAYDIANKIAELINKEKVTCGQTMTAIVIVCCGIVASSKAMADDLDGVISQLGDQLREGVLAILEATDENSA